MIMAFMGHNGRTTEKDQAKEHGLEPAQNAETVGKHCKNPDSRHAVWSDAAGTGRLNHAMQGVLGGRRKPTGSVPVPVSPKGASFVMAPMGADRVNEEPALRATEQMMLQQSPSSAPSPLP